jgi:glycerate 2-kinase
MNNISLILSEIFYGAIREVNPVRAVKRHVEEIRAIYRDGGFNRMLVIASGKAACAMADPLEDTMSDIMDGGMVITKYGHVDRRLPHFRMREAGHPIPDEKGIRATARVVKLLEEATERTLVVMPISGGASSLLVSPCEGLTLREKQEVTSLLLTAGADIGEMNTVRKHLSRVKGGRLAAVAAPAAIVSLILSDVIGDRMDVIASGLTCPDPTTFDDALAVLMRHGVMDLVPRNALELLERGSRGLIAETPKPGDPLFSRVRNILIGNNRMALDGAKREAEQHGIMAEILTSELSGDVREAAHRLAKRALAVKSEKGNGGGVCLISGGETTVNVRGPGLGGRNQELALAFAMEIEGTAGITLLSAGTDGTDGPTDAAGAVSDGQTIGKARALGIDPAAHLRDNDSYNFFRKSGGLFVTGPTGTNVMDVQIMIIE